MVITCETIKCNHIATYPFLPHWKTPFLTSPPLIRSSFSTGSASTQQSAPSQLARRERASRIGNAPTNRHNQMCFVRRTRVQRTKHMESAGHPATPQPDTTDVSRSLLSLTGDAVSISIQLGAVSWVASIQGGRARSPRRLAVGIVGTALFRHRRGFGSRSRDRLTATTLSIRIQRRLGFRSNRLRRGFGRRDLHRRARRWRRRWRRARCRGGRRSGSRRRSR